MIPGVTLTSADWWDFDHPNQIIRSQTDYHHQV